MKVINVGVYPPPYGGVSMHLKRLLEYLQLQGIECLLIDLSLVPKKQVGIMNLNWRQAIFYLLVSESKSIVHFHNFGLKNIVVYFLISLRHRTILSFHNERFLDELNSRGILWKRILLIFLNYLDYFVVDNHHCKKMAEEIIRDKARIVIIPEFIPSSVNSKVSNETVKKMRRKHTYLLTSNAFQISFHKNQDLYGIDILVELVNRLIHIHNMDVGMVFILPNIGDMEYFDELNKRLYTLGLTEHFCFITEPVEDAVSIWRISDIVVRATNTDGNSLTVMEALHARIPVIASDCSERPEGTILFKTRDINDLCEKVITVLSTPNNYKVKLKDIRIIDHAAEILKLYESVGGIESKQGVSY